MLISIVTPTFNSEKMIPRTLASVRSQDYKDLEHVIIDNQSTDGTKELAEKAYQDEPEKLRFISEQDQGISDAFNKGVRAAKGEVIAILNSDDFYNRPTLVSEVMELFKNDPELDVVHGDMIFEDDQFGTNNRAPILKPIAYGTPFNHPTMFVRRRVYDKFGLFDLDYRYAMDFEFVARFYTDRDHEEAKSHYLQGDPMVTMCAGGVSDRLELKALAEVEQALVKNGKYDALAKKAVRERRLRYQLKGLFSKLGLEAPVKWWRRMKWGN